MKKFILLLAYILLIINITQAEEPERKPKTDAMLFGDVMSGKEHVPFASILLKGTTIGIATDATGHFKMTNLPIGEQTLVISAVGFKTKTQKVILKAKESVTLRIKLEPDYIGLEQVVVSADRNQANRAEAPVVVTSISPKLFVQTQSINIAEGLCFTPGLRTECNCQNCGFTQLRMNGMDGPYTQILMNSRPVFSGLAGVYGLELIPANMVERVEVVRGGGSALFGGNAIAGTVNILTKEPLRNTFSIDSRLGVIGVGGHENTPVAYDRQVSLNASVISDDIKTGGYVYGLLRNKDEYDENGDDFSESVRIKNTTFGFNVFHKPSDKSKISIDGYRINEFRRGGNMFDYLPHETDITEQLKHNITGANIAFDLFTNSKYDKLTIYGAAQHVERDSYYGAQQDPNAYGYTTDLTNSFGGQYIINSDHFLFAPSTTLIGIDNTNNALKDNKLGTEGKTNVRLTDQMVNTLGSFIQQDWKSEKLNFSLGLRYDYYNITDKAKHAQSDNDISEGVLAPRANLLFKANPNLRFRLGYARGYRAPQIFNEDLHIELVNAKRVLHKNADNLKQESSNAFTASINTNFHIGTSTHNFLVEGFYIQLIDPFSDEFEEIDPKAGTWQYLRINAEDGANVFGANFELNSYFSPIFDMQLGFTVQKSEFETPQAWGDEDNSVSKKFMRTPDTYGYATFNFSPFKNFRTTLSLNYTGSMKVPHMGLNPNTENPTPNDLLEQEAINKGYVIKGERLETSEQFLITDLLFSYDFGLTPLSRVEVYAGVKNIFNQTQEKHDKGVFRDAAYIYGPCQPRTLNFGIKIKSL